MRQYETLMVLHPEIPEAQTRETIDRAKRLIEGMGGTVSQMQEWGMRELAYSIRKFTRGYYVIADYSASPEVVRELERTLKIADEVLRFMTVAPMPVRQSKKPAKVRRRPESSAAGSPPARPEIDEQGV